MSGEISLKGERTTGPLVVIKPSELAKAGTTGTVAEGIYEGTKPNPGGVTKDGRKYGPSTEYKIRGANDTLFILKETKAIKEQLGSLASDGSDNARVRVQYNGKVETKNGQDYHDFEVFMVPKEASA